MENKLRNARMEGGSHNVFPRKNRSYIEIMAAILEKAAQGARKTQMMYGANLSFYQIEVYIKYMVKKGFLSFEEKNGLYWTTSKGREFLKSYESVKLLMSPPISELKINNGSLE